MLPKSSATLNHTTLTPRNLQNNNMGQQIRPIRLMGRRLNGISVFTNRKPRGLISRIELLLSASRRQLCEIWLSVFS